MFVTVVFFIPRSVLLTFQTMYHFTQKFWRDLEQKLWGRVETLSPIASATTGCLYFPIFVLELLSMEKFVTSFLTDRTKGSAYATVLRLSSVCLFTSSVTLCIVAKRCILEQKLLLRAYRKSYEKSIGTKVNDLDLCLEVVSRSCQPLRYIWCWISRKPLEIEVWFQRTTNRKWHMGYQMVTWPLTSPDPNGINASIKYRSFVPTTMGNFRFPASPPAVSGIESLYSVVFY